MLGRPGDRQTRSLRQDDSVADWRLFSCFADDTFTLKRAGTKKGRLSTAHS